jgi:hypothetical protein
MLQCSRCHRELTEAQSYVNQGKIYCEDCLMDIGLSIKECDPWATYVDTSGRKRHGEKGAAGMTDIEAKIYAYIKGRGKATRQEVMQSFGLSEADLMLQLLPLMHDELIKERGEGGQMYFVPIA